MPVADRTARASGYRAVEFTSDGAALRGRPYLPRRWPAPVVVINEVDGGHFGLLKYPGHAFDQASQPQAAWLARTLGNGASGRLPSWAAGS